MRIRRSDSSRLEAFSDGVFAFAATLLVVSLEVPRTFDELLAELSGFGAFALGFGALILLWVVHNAYFRRYALEDRWTIALNGCLLFVILFYVFPLKFVAAGITGFVFGLGDYTRMPTLGSYDELVALFLLYGLGFALIFTFVALMYRHAARRADTLGLDPQQLHEAHVLKRHYAIFVLVALLSMLLAWPQVGISVGFPGWIYALLGPLCWAHATWSNRGRTYTSYGNEKEVGPKKPLFRALKGPFWRRKRAGIPQQNEGAEMKTKLRSIFIPLLAVSIGLITTTAEAQESEPEIAISGSNYLYIQEFEIATGTIPNEAIAEAQEWA